MKKLFLSMFLFFIPLFSSSTTKIYTVAFLKDWKPYYIIEDDNKLNGYTYELFKEISKKANLKFEYKVINTWKEVFELAKNGEIDIVPNVGITKNRELLFNFTQPTDTFKIRLFKKHNTFSISNMEDLKTNKVGVISANACNKLITNEISSKKIVFSDLAIALSSLIKGDIDILCYPQSHMNEKLNELEIEDKIISFEKPLIEIKRGVGITKENFDLLPILNDAISDLKIEGTAQKIYLKWFSKEKISIISQETFFNIMILLSIVIIALFSLIYWNNKLKKEYQKKKILEKKLEYAQKIASLGHFTYLFKNKEFICSNQLNHILGLEEKQIKNFKVWVKNIHPDDRQRVVNYWLECVKNKLDYKIEYRFINLKTKKIIWIKVIGEINRDNKSNTITMFGTVQNIDERKKIEKKLSQAMMVFENTNDGIIITDKNTNIINVNKSFEITTGYSLKDVINKKPSILKSDLNEDSFYFKMWNELNSRGTWSGEIVNKKKDGTIYYEILTVNVIFGTNKEISGYIGIFTDITQQKSDEKMIVSQSKVAAIGEMLGNISHQWRQPLSIISTYSTGLKMQLEFNDNINKDDVFESMDKINSQVQYLSKTIDDFRNFFRGDTSDIKEFNIKDAFCKLEELTKDSLKDNYIKYYNKSVDAKLLLNENLFIQALINIFNNAKDAIVYNQENSEDRFLFVESKIIDKNLEISIKDSGNGVPLNIMEKIFDPYFTTKHSSIGTGIGLYMTNQIITKQFKGQILVSNIEIENNDKTLIGAEFKITLPLEDI